jgi:hypothetical protein
VSDSVENHKDHDVLVRRATTSDSAVIAEFARAFHAEDNHPLSDEGVAGLLLMLEPGFADGIVLLLEIDLVAQGCRVLSFCYGYEHGGRRPSSKTSMSFRNADRRASGKCCSTRWRMKPARPGAAPSIWKSCREIAQKAGIDGRAGEAVEASYLRSRSDAGFQLNMNQACAMLTSVG